MFAGPKIFHDSDEAYVCLSTANRSELLKAITEKIVQLLDSCIELNNFAELESSLKIIAKYVHEVSLFSAIDTQVYSSFPDIILGNVSNYSLSNLDSISRDLSKTCGLLHVFNRNVIWLIEPRIFSSLKRRYEMTESAYIYQLFSSDLVQDGEDSAFCLLKIILRSTEFEDVELTKRLSSSLLKSITGIACLDNIRPCLEAKIKEVFKSNHIPEYFNEVFANIP